MNRDQGGPRPRAVRLRRRALLVYGAFALALIPWTAYLGSSLPSTHETQHWDVLWAGFDVGLLLAGAATAVAVLRGSRHLPIAASVTGTLLLCDAWFDLWTSRPGSERLWAAGEAALGEVPLALFSFWVAHDAERMCAATQRYVAERRVRRRERIARAASSE
jgi:hypothetical protein